MTIDSVDDSKISNRTINTNRISNRTYDSKSNRITKLRRSLIISEFSHLAPNHYWECTRQCAAILLVEQVYQPGNSTHDWQYSLFSGMHHNSNDHWCWQLFSKEQLKRWTFKMAMYGHHWLTTQQMLGKWSGISWHILLHTLG